jgi:UDP-N-acetyl-D-mannosaminuronic acid dehydrogenase
MASPAEDFRNTFPAPFTHVAVIGAGYVGLPMALHVANSGVRVTAVDTNETVVREINERTSKVEEKEDFEKFFGNPMVQHNLSARTTPVEADAFIVAVPTPIHQDKSPDVNAVIAATESIVPFVRPGNLVVIESTIPVHTTEKVVQPILEKSGFTVGKDILLAHCPERILPGNIMAEAVFNARIIGGVDKASTDRAVQLYSLFVKGKLLITDARTAEFVKLIENASRDVAVAFANQVALLCEYFGINVSNAIELANHHPRIQILDPGIGVGGHCIPIDPWFLVHSNPELTGLIQAARVLNDGMPAHTVNRIMAAVEGIPNARVVCLGASYKPNVKDLRESPALEVFELLKHRGVNAELYDPLIPQYACDSVMSVARGADALAILTPHDLIVTEIRYRKHQILAVMRHPKILTFNCLVL